MFHQWDKRQFAWGGYGPEEHWQGWNAEQEAGEGEWHHGHHHGHHGHRHEQHGGHGRGPGWHGEHGPGPGGPWQSGFGWQPWMRRGLGAAPLVWWLWAMRRGFGGPGPGRGPGGRGPRAFGRGDLKYQLLALLTERPKHGYEMIKELEEQAGGFYTPSAGAVYPSLQLMEDRGWITSQTADGKKVYTITDAGRQALKEHQEQAEEFGGPWGRGGGPWGGHHGGAFGPQARPELEALRNEGMEVARLLVTAVMHAGGDPAKLARVREIIASTRRQLEDLLSGSPGTPDKGHAPDPEARTQKLNQDAKPDEYI